MNKPVFIFLAATVLSACGVPPAQGSAEDPNDDIAVNEMGDGVRCYVLRNWRAMSCVQVQGGRHGAE